MQLRDTRLLLVILGIPSSNFHKLLAQGVDLFQRASSSEGVLCIRKYWDSHSSTFSKLPAVALLAPGSCPKGLAPGLFLQLLRRLTDLQEWQIWDLWDTLDVHSCGFVGCAEFTLLVVLLCAGAAHRQLQAVHAYAGSMCRTFLGTHVGSSYAGLQQCCLLLALPVAGLHTALLQLQQRASQQQLSSSCNGSSSSDGQAAAAAAALPVSRCSGCSCSPGRRHSSSAGSSSSSSRCALHPSQAAAANAPGSTAKPAPAGAGAAAPGAAGTGLGCCCHSGGCQGGAQWACGAAAHRRACASGVVPLGAGQGGQGGILLAQKCPPHTLLTVQDVELLLFQIAAAHDRRSEYSSELQLEDGTASRGQCRIC